MKPLSLFLLFAVFFLLFSMHFTTSAEFNQDLGRHIKIGEIIIQTKQIPATNLFSYTNPDFPFVNHHWLSEVLFYLFSAPSGSSALILLKTTIILSSIGLLIALGYHLRYPLVTIFTALLFSPLFLERSTIRPEMFGYVLFSCMLSIFFTYPSHRRLLIAVPFIMLLWINLHISFIFGLVLLGFLLLKIILLSYKKSHTLFPLSKSTVWEVGVVAAGIIATLFNPNGVYGLLYPFRIFDNYGYNIVENQNVFYLSSLIINPHIKYLFFLSPIIIGSLIVLVCYKKFLEAALLALFFVADMMQIRHMPFFALTAIPTVSLSIHSIVQKIRLQDTHKILVSAMLAVLCLGFSIFFIQNRYVNTFDQQKSFGMSMKEDGKLAADFMFRNRLPQRIFNNFDIGGYAIYKLYPEYKVFVDNRPEAYPKSFLEDVYIKLQLDKDLREKIFKQYDIKTIFFAHTEQTYWGEGFVQQIYADTRWKLVYLDHTMMIMTLDTKLKDIRNNKEYFTNLIKNESDYLNLVELFHVFNLFHQSDLAEAAFMKANELNPTSCVINKSLYASYMNSPLKSKALDIKNNFWYCF